MCSCVYEYMCMLYIYIYLYWNILNLSFISGLRYTCIVLHVFFNQKYYKKLETDF